MWVLAGALVAMGGAFWLISLRNRSFTGITISGVPTREELYAKILVGVGVAILLITLLFHYVL